MATAIQAAERVLHQLKTQVGFSAKKRHINVTGALFAEAFLAHEKGTIDFDPTDPDVKRLGVKTIYELMAYRHPLQDSGCGLSLISVPTDRDRFYSVENHAKTYERGCAALEEAMVQAFGTRFPIYKVPRNVSRLLIEVITIDPQHAVNDHQTAREIARSRGRKRVKGTIKTLAKRELAYTGNLREFVEHAQVALSDIERQPLPAPRLSLSSN